VNVVWFRSDLRTTDHAALCAAVAEGEAVRGLFFACGRQWRSHDWGDRKIAFLRGNLIALGEALAGLGIPLDVLCDAERFSEIPRALGAYVQRHGVRRVFAHHEYEVNEITRDEACDTALDKLGVPLSLHHDQCIVPPGRLQTGSGGSYVVFTPFRRSWRALLEDDASLMDVAKRPRAVGDRVTPPEVPDFPGRGSAPPGDEDRWPAGEAAAQKRLASFVRDRLMTYHERRDLPAEDGTSSLSPYLALGVISARQCLAAARAADEGRLDGAPGAATWISELAWRDFYRHILVAFPRICRGQPFRLQTNAVRWRDDDEGFAAWCAGRTGIPIVDAAMQQLLATGWMHNRLRMVTAMFLTKNLLIDWRRGEAFFMRQLVDGDFASNNGGWQWSASTGTDAAPYFRVFNPVSQGERFDAEGDFLRAWLPAFDGIRAKQIHQPWTQTELSAKLAERGYPARPIVDLASSRKRAIEAFREV